MGGDQFVEILHIPLGIYFFLVGNVEKWGVITSFSGREAGINL